MMRKLVRRERTPLAAPVAGPEMTDLEKARSDVFEKSGWGLRMQVLQPRNAAFWVFWGLSLAGLWQAVTILQSFAAPFAGAVTANGSVLVLYAALLWLVTRAMDRYSTLPITLVVHAFIWSATAGTFFMAIYANDAILSLYAKAFGQRWVSDWAAGLTAPFTEEIAKGIGLVLLITLARRIVTSTFDAFILGAFLGLGFQVVEDLLYVAQTSGGDFGSNPFLLGFITLFFRIVTGVAGHIAYSAIFATGLFLLVGSPVQRRRVGLGISLMLTAMALHGVWDSIAGLIGADQALQLLFTTVLMVIVLFLVFRVFRFAVQPEKDDLRVVLAPEVAAGLVMPDEVEAVVGTRKDRRRFVKRTKPRAERRQRRALLTSIHDLAEALPHRDDLEHISFSRREIARLRGGG